MRYAALSSNGLALPACNARQASRPVPFAVQDPRRTQLEYCAHQIALADSFQVSTERGTFLERPVADIRQQRKELLWLGSRVDEDTLRAMALARPNGCAAVAASAIRVDVIPDLMTGDSR